MSIALSAMSFVVTSAQNLSTIGTSCSRWSCLFSSLAYLLFPHKVLALAVFREQLVVWYPCHAIGRDYYCKEETHKREPIPCTFRKCLAVLSSTFLFLLWANPIQRGPISAEWTAPRKSSRPSRISGNGCCCHNR